MLLPKILMKTIFSSSLTYKMISSFMLLAISLLRIIYKSQNPFRLNKQWLKQRVNHIEHYNSLKDDFVFIIIWVNSTQTIFEPTFLTYPKLRSLRETSRLKSERELLRKSLEISMWWVRFYQVVLLKMTNRRGSKKNPFQSKSKRPMMVVMIMSQSPISSLSITSLLTLQETSTSMLHFLQETLLWLRLSKTNPSEWDQQEPRLTEKYNSKRRSLTI